MKHVMLFVACLPTYLLVIYKLAPISSSCMITIKSNKNIVSSIIQRIHSNQLQTKKENLIEELSKKKILLIPVKTFQETKIAMNSDSKYKLVYFNIRGLAEPIRWMFLLKNIDFEDERIDLDLWKEEKQRFKKQIGQLPILYVDDDFELTQAHTIMRFIAKDFDLIGGSEMETARADEVCEMLYEIRLCAVDFRDSYTTKNPDIVRHTIFRDFANEKSISKKVLMRKHLVQQTFPMYMKKFAQFLEDSDGEYIAGPNLTYADLALANFLDVCEDLINPDILNDFPTLRALKEEILDIPEIAEWVSLNKASSAVPA